METWMQNLHRVYRALEQIQEKSFQELNTLFKVFVIIYADDTVVLVESEEGMQNALDGTWMEIGQSEDRILISINL
jgi:hypothetical protein